MTIKNNLRISQFVPENSAAQIHSKNPPSSLLRQVPPFWHGFGEQASKYMTNYHNSSFYRMQMLQIVILQTSPCTCCLDAHMNILVINNNISQFVPENPAVQLHSKFPSPPVLVQVPLF